MNRRFWALFALLWVLACADDSGGDGGASAQATASQTSTVSTGGLLPPRTDPCREILTAQDCDLAPPFPQCKWFTRRVAPGCAGLDTVEDEGCYSLRSRCDPQPDFVGPDPPTTVCGEGQTCTPFETVGLDCTGGVEAQSLSCQDACAEWTYSLCLPVFPP